MLTYITTVTLVRISILLLYRRIFDVNPFRTITAVLIATCVAWGVSIAAANIFQCHTITDAFKPEVVAAFDGRCINLQAMFYGTLGTGFTLDLIILILPIHRIWTLRLEPRQKYELTAILALGGLYVINYISFFALKVFLAGCLAFSPAGSRSAFLTRDSGPRLQVLC